MPSSTPSTRSDADLLRTQQGLQDAATAAVTDLGLDTALAALGNPTRTGSSALGLMVRRDVDITIACPKLDAATKTAVAELGARIGVHERVRTCLYRDDTGRWNTDPDLPDGVYLKVDYRAPDDHDWTFDLWFVDEPERMPDLGHLETLAPRVTTGARVAILRIKQALDAGPDYGKSIHGIDVYDAVLDHGVTTPEEFTAHWRARTENEA
jgi:hypothetical protein